MGNFFFGVNWEYGCLIILYIYEKQFGDSCLLFMKLLEFIYVVKYIKSSKRVNRKI